MAAPGEMQNRGRRNEKNCKLNIPKKRTYRKRAITLLAVLSILMGPIVLTGQLEETNCAYTKYELSGPAKRLMSKMRKAANISSIGRASSSSQRSQPT
ncbi:MAG: hypothetical protein MPL62_11860 [Alphaproteobacteria bacterium]|nr:hypothetical protein [Alphaproteobacteria bacterium]